MIKGWSCIITIKTTTTKKVVTELKKRNKKNLLAVIIQVKENPKKILCISNTLREQYTNSIRNKTVEITTTKIPKMQKQSHFFLFFR